MPIITRRRYTRADLQSNPNSLFTFGDNLAQKGLGGQARECRGEPNAVGIPTKRAPSMAAGAFLTDGDLTEVRPIMQAAFRRLAAHLGTGGVVVWPKDGVGTGLADLERRAPRVWNYLKRCECQLFRLTPPQ